jgi:hypothetical protein
MYSKATSIALLTVFFAIEAASAQSKYFVIQNVATDRTRVYERCSTSESCPHKLILETRSLFGMPKDEDLPGADKYRLRTWLGTFKIQTWKKFYADGKGKHAPWWGPGFPELPRKNSSLFSWISPYYMPDGYAEDGMRGAFGWYAAILSPVPDGQWMHGTFGWGADKDNFLNNQVQENGHGYLNFSSGCARVENRAIAWMQHNLPKGTEVYRVYAIEELADPSLKNYAAAKSKRASWDWILTTETTAESSDAAAVRARLNPSISILEQGTFILDQYPGKVSIKHSRSDLRSIGARTRKDFMIGNNYLLPRNEFQGVFLIDEGRFRNYLHPARLTAHASKEIPRDLQVP